MKKTILTVLAVVAFVLNSNAQTEHLDGETRIVNPNIDGRNLIVEKELGKGNLWSTFHIPQFRWYSMGIDANTGFFRLGYGSKLDDDNIHFLINKAGNIAMGATPSSSYRLNVLGQTKLQNVGSGRILMLEKEDNDSWLTFHDPGNGWYSMGYDNSINKFSINPGGDLNNNNKFVIDNQGNIGIGTANPDAKLTVKGKIHAEEVKIDLNVAPDYVFQKYYLGTSTLKADYVMPTLADVEAYTKVHHHLPEIPSAKQLQEDGVQVGYMVNKLLQKIEELTLYTIEQEKQLRVQNSRIEQLEKSLNNN